MFKSMFRNKLTRKRRNDRRGGAIVETAFCIPLVIILMLGTLEVCSAIYLYESLKVAAFEGVRIGIRRGGQRQEVINRTNEVLAARGVVIPSNNPQYGVAVTPADFSTMNAMDPITVTVSAPTASNSLFIFSSFANKDVQARVVMVREFDD